MCCWQDETADARLDREGAYPLDDDGTSAGVEVEGGSEGSEGGRGGGGGFLEEARARAYSSGAWSDEVRAPRVRAPIRLPPAASISDRSGAHRRWFARYCSSRVADSGADSERSTAEICG